MTSETPSSETEAVESDDPEEMIEWGEKLTPQEVEDLLRERRANSLIDQEILQRMEKDIAEGRGHLWEPK